MVIKLGGVLLDSEEALERLFTALVTYREKHERPLVIMHGGGCLVDDLMKKLALPVVKKNGLRVTPADQIDIITGALAGTANKTLLAWAVKHDINAVGLCLGDGNTVSVTPLDAALGHVGKAEAGSPALVQTLLAANYMPIISSIGITKDGSLMNVNADQAATALAATLGADLILLSDVSGILDGKGQRIAEMTAQKAEQLIAQGIITDGMVVKVNAALDAARSLGRPVDIASWRHADQLPALFNGVPIGTRILA
ncbi:acetylglutamate kinase [Yersinia enterocolitica (type O:9) str. YE212/02]|uniref:Acetylglutamate kinase n=1 Tax=Yersinia enterocolitica serotype O:8 / biotype 1B (strain NCTC 13174 / 8081) TaxID=393305 RepID=ARGB_YERE8|nr:RecName: Full=Acetylglutamate kinase; AltName: Full=N-acetyl-L-glutamate 5-phosphotransferase; AltName: Full=NAG kinase; Short=NAGK [Yersinia enterocolitica subsp. enterocolitica 8081]CCV28087.1 acetylglutamate kinase [Yersinia enterocolitica (type O:9) str. YE212/02]CCV35926.1 acetylglutamate kinase [Yersinia enterocolitica (type O:9) str. YE56/03]CCV43823.1 acetylglutamate kinase [Yersinia enterocolitica (type O:5,27) str. YE149/02]CCV51719.1 acetylglutamate kinase [Yersinia enterocolitica